MLKQRVQTTNPKLEQHKELPLHICKPPLSQSTLPLKQGSNATRKCNKEMQQRAKFCSFCLGWLDSLPNIWPPGWRLDRSKRLALHQTFQKLPEPIGTPSKCSQVRKSYTNFSPCWQCMNQGKMRKVSTYSFSNIQKSSQGATHVQMSKLDTLQVCNDLNYKTTKFHNHWTRLKRIWAILRKFTLSRAKS
jgi:hypothetical protein